ncbi:hypothetical protein R5R35_008885 [Gryllus longicercus]|uniref:Accessory gland protein n=1 Tax=Gryllus longicercus TaxID=2509291 RepID=A0AAN9VCS6_9ORTH
MRLSLLLLPLLLAAALLVSLPGAAGDALQEGEDAPLSPFAGEQALEERKLRSAEDDLAERVKRSPQRFRPPSPDRPRPPPPPRPRPRPNPRPPPPAPPNSPTGRRG